MSTTIRSRHDSANLLARPPCVLASYNDNWAKMIVDPAEQLNALADLVARGLLSPVEFEQQKRKLFEW
jgi:hypothetical protein